MMGQVMDMMHGTVPKGTWSPLRGWLVRGVPGKTNGHVWQISTVMVTAVVIMNHGTRRWVGLLFRRCFCLFRHEGQRWHEVVVVFSLEMYCTVP